MDNFIFYNPTQIIFGQNQQETFVEQIRKYSSNILLIIGGGSVKANGIFDKFISLLNKYSISYSLLEGIVINPRLAKVQEGINLVKKNNIDFILALGGGSVIDTAKAIALGSCYDGDVWDFYINKAKTEPKALPIGVYLTIPASGSESSFNSVITNEAQQLKVGFASPVLIPKFSLLDPTVCYSIPKDHILAGCFDIISHLLERYFTNTPDGDYVDSLIVSSIKTVMDYLPVVLKDNKDYNAWSQIMWAGTLAHNGLLNTGRVGDWASHALEHALSAKFDLVHGLGLAVVFPAWMSFTYKHNPAKYNLLGSRLFNLVPDPKHSEKIAVDTIAAFKKYLTSYNYKISLKDYGIAKTDIPSLADIATRHDTISVGHFVTLKREEIIKIYTLAY